MIDNIQVKKSAELKHSLTNKSIFLITKARIFWIRKTFSTLERERVEKEKK